MTLSSGTIYRLTFRLISIYTTAHLPPRIAVSALLAVFISQKCFNFFQCIRYTAIVGIEREKECASCIRHGMVIRNVLPLIWLI